LLHAPAFQRVEATWRGLRWLVFESQLGAALEVYVLDATRADILADLRACAGDLERSHLYRAVVREPTASPGSTPFSLVIGDFSFEGSEEDVSLLAGLGAVAGYAGGCFLAAAEPALWGCRDLAREPERGFWSPLDPALAARMAALRESAVAPFIGLAMPRVLGRVPYGAKTDPVERFAFEELPPDPAHAAFLWINGAFACAQLILAGVAEQGWEAGPGSQHELSDLPHVVYRAFEGNAIKPCAEVYLDEASAKHVLGFGVMPFMSYRNRNAVRLLRLQSIAQPAAALALQSARS
jgi:type VI secretion system protein ImpC